MKEQKDAGDAGHGDSPRQDSQRPDQRDAGQTGGHESRNDVIPGSQSRAEPRPAGTPAAPGELHRDPALPTSGRQPERPGQDGRYERVLGDRDTETLKPSDSGPAEPGPPK
jgi:hypothetical protein